jgi:hypothetical protein
MTTILNQPIAETKVVAQAVDAPLSGNAIVTTGVLPAGTYRLHIVTHNVGTAETTAAGMFNMAIRHGSTVVGALASTTSSVRQEIERITVNGAESINVVPTVNAIAGSIYLASICATRLGS